MEIDGALPEGAEVVVLTRGDEESFELDDAQLSELELRMDEADRQGTAISQASCSRRS